MTEERSTPSGIFLPEPDPDKGHPVAVAFLDMPGMSINIAAATADEIRDVAMRIYQRQCEILAGDLDGGPLEITEPQYGKRAYIMPAGLQRVTSVVHGFAVKVDPMARIAAEQRTAGIALPSRRGN